MSWRDYILWHKYLFPDDGPYPTYSYSSAVTPILPTNTGKLPTRRVTLYAFRQIPKDPYVTLTYYNKPYSQRKMYPPKREHCRESNQVQ